MSHAKGFSVEPSDPLPGRVLLVAPRLDARGGIVSVNSVYEHAGLLRAGEKAPRISFHPSTRDGSRTGKLLFAGGQILAFAFAPATGRWVLHLHTGCYASFWRKAAYAWIGRLKGARVLVHVHPDLFAEYYDRGGPIRRRAIRATLSKASALIALRKPMAHKLAALAPGRPVHVLPNPIDLDSMRLEPPPPRGPATVLFLGWYLQEKGVYDLLDAIARLRASRPGIRAVLGGYRDETRLRRRVEELGLGDAVTIAGWAGRSEVIRLLHTCTVFALPSYTEGMPMVLLEAMACGAPIVTCPVGGVPDMVSEGRNALFVRPGDVAGLASAIERVLSDPAIASAMSRANLEDVKRFDVKTLLPKLLEIYSSLL